MEYDFEAAGRFPRCCSGDFEGGGSGGLGTGGSGGSRGTGDFRRGRCVTAELRWTVCSGGCSDPSEKTIPDSRFGSSAGQAGDGADWIDGKRFTGSVTMAKLDWSLKFGAAIVIPGWRLRDSVMAVPGEKRQQREQLPSIGESTVVGGSSSYR